MNKEQSLKAVDKVINAYKIERAVDVCDSFSYNVFENAYRMHAPQIASLCNVSAAITGALVAGLVSTKILELVVLKKHYLTHEINKYKTMKKLIEEGRYSLEGDTEEQFQEEVAKNWCK